MRLKLISAISFMLFLSACSGPVKQSLTNFRAHYNAFYNAEKKFRAGEKKVLDQPVTIDPEAPIRVHRKPPRAGVEDFERAIEKAASVLIDFPDSKWTDDALFLIGRSYYYQSEFYRARQKFEELFNITENEKMKQQAVVWKGHTLLDLKAYSEGSSYLEEQLNDLQDIWKPSLKAEARVLLGEHQAMLQNWETTADHLWDSIADLPESPLKGRTFFLLGQVLERLERFGEAYFAYNNVEQNFPVYEYVYWAKLYKGRMARSENNTGHALSIFNEMKRDDKNFDRKDEVNFHIARTKETTGDYRESEALYKQILYSGGSAPPSSGIQAKTYYRLGKIYSSYYADYERAAAYFDSSSSRASYPRQNAARRDVNRLASAYGKYASLKSAESNIDSLLWLGSLNAGELDSVVLKVRAQRVRERTEQRPQNRPSKILVNVTESDRQNGEGETGSDFGFLNHKNLQLVNRAKREFRAVWGDRPPVDNWRWTRVRKGDNIARDTAGGNSPVERNIPQEFTDRELGIDLNEIPANAQQEEELKKKRAGLWYEIGNLFFLTLSESEPDSATVYYNKVAAIDKDYDLVAKAKYALFEVYNVSQDTGKARYWGNRVLEEHSSTRYAERVREKRGLQEAVSIDSDSTSTTSTISLSTCRELEINPEVKPGMQAFLQSISLPDPPGDREWPESLTYQIRITGEGEVLDYRLQSGNAFRELEEAYSHAIKDSLRFYPLPGSYDGGIRCEVTFPVRG